jgi:hypothetical protein
MGKSFNRFQPRSIDAIPIGYEMKSQDRTREMNFPFLHTVHLGLNWFFSPDESASTPGWVSPLITYTWWFLWQLFLTYASLILEEPLICIARGDMREPKWDSILQRMKYIVPFTGALFPLLVGWVKNSWNDESSIGRNIILPGFTMMATSFILARFVSAIRKTNEQRRNERVVMRENRELERNLVNAIYPSMDALDKIHGKQR